MSTESDTTELKALVVDAVSAAKALLSYLDKHPGRLSALKAEFKEKLGMMAVMKLAKFLF